MHERGFAVDRGTQAWVRATGRSVRLDDCPWLDGPVGSPPRIGDEWLAREAERLGGELCEGGGLLGSFDLLAGDGFDASRLAPEIVRFYERTTEWRLDAWSQWCPAALPAGWILSTVFARRLQQLALPLRPLDVAQGMAAVRRVPLAERFRVYVDDEGTLRTDHALNLWSIPTLRLHYRLEPKSK
ncbi:MAG: hypothetical protein QOF59_2150 [Actinomycetota bacterium]|nr:hypothetical protein [Actinomycetota bacterium]